MADQESKPKYLKNATSSVNAMAGHPLVSVLVVVRNGRQDIVGVLDSIRRQDYAPLEVLVVDGMSEDGTRELVRECAAKEQDFSIRLLDNKGRIQASGWNAGIRAANGDYVLRIDAVHCRLEPEYIRCCLAKLVELQKTDPAVAATGGRRLSVAAAQSSWSEAIALAQSCRFGVGNADYRLGTEAGFKDTLGVPLYDRRMLLSVGLFDESLGRSEDNDLHARLRWQGFKLYFTPDTTAVYFPRTTLAGLASQMFNNGWWVSATLVRKHSYPFGVRHLIPFAFYLLLTCLLAIGVLGLVFGQVMLGALVGIYLSASLAAAVRAARSRLFLRVAVVFWLMHACYAAGTACGFFAGKNGQAIEGEFTAPGSNQGT